jgi:hypothetical protein
MNRPTENVTLMLRHVNWTVDHEYIAAEVVNANTSQNRQIHHVMIRHDDRDHRATDLHVAADLLEIEVIRTEDVTEAVIGVEYFPSLKYSLFICIHMKIYDFSLNNHFISFYRER